MQSLGFENYAEALKIYLSKYRDSIKVEKDVSPGKQEGSALGDHNTVQATQDPTMVSYLNQAAQPNQFYG